jgi:hypothetical protein
LAIARTSRQADSGEQAKLNFVRHGHAGELIPRILELESGVPCFGREEKFWGAVYSINVSEDDMKLVFLAKPRLLYIVMDGGPLSLHRTRI